MQASESPRSCSEDPLVGGSKVGGGYRLTRRTILPMPAKCFALSIEMTRKPHHCGEVTDMIRHASKTI
jgi:hypothetical protein